MPSNNPLSVYQNNDTTIDMTVTSSGEPLNLTDVTLTFYVKPSQDMPDSSATTYAPVVDDAEQGTCHVLIPATDLATAAVKWWRLQVLNGGNSETAQFGAFTILAV